MVTEKNSTRRTFLKYGGVATIAGLAGCMGGNGDDDNGNGNGNGNGGGQLNIIVPWSQGGGTDRSMRATVPAWSERLGDDIVVNNYPGGSTQVGGEQLYNSDPDGNTIAMWNLPQMQATWMFQDAPYDGDDFDYIGTHHLDPTMWFAPEDVPYDDMAEFIDYAEDSDDEMNVGTTAAIGNTALSAVIVQDAIDAEFNLVNLEGGSPTREAVLAGDVDAAVNQPWAFNPDHEGEVTDLGTHNSEETDLWDTPSFGDLGLDYIPLVEEGFGQWKIMVAPGGTAEENPDRWDQLVDTYADAMQSDEFLDNAAEQGQLDLIVEYLGPDEATQQVEDYTAFMEEHGDLLDQF